MSGLINLVSDHGEDLIILPLMALISLIVCILLHLFFDENKIIKYIPGIILIIASIIVSIYALSIFTTPKGLDFAWVAIFIAVSGIVGVITGFIIDLIGSIIKSYNEYEKESKKSANKQRKQKK
ncbi:MAG: hypothetical protein Q4B52_00605 [Tissierellia bacterium]|nr:hypothetical protein [Tissierellia bacterium]